jgi:YD repeat-containing protein
MNKQVIFQLSLVCLLYFCLSGCQEKSGDTSPQPANQDALPKTFTSTLGETTKTLQYDAQGRLIRSTVLTGTYKDQYNYYEYEAGAVRFGYGIPPSPEKTVILEYTLKDGLPVEANDGPKWVITNRYRYFNYRFDAEKRLLGYEYEYRQQSNNTLIGAVREEYTWKDGNVVRRQRFNPANNQVLQDLTYEYDLTRTNRLFSGFAIERPHFGVENPAGLYLPKCGLGVKNILVNVHTTGKPATRAYIYTFDDQNRVLSIQDGGYTLSFSY